MKKLIVGSILIALNAVALGQGVLLEQGQNYVFEFTSIPYLRPTAAGDHSQVIAWFEPGTFSANENARLEIFSNSLADSPLSNSGAYIEEYPSGRAGLPYWWVAVGPNASPPFFPDLQGILRVTMLDGTARLSGFEVAQIIDGDFYTGYFAVPEPAVGTLFAAALACLVFFRIKDEGDQQTRCSESRDDALAAYSGSVTRDR